MADKVVSLSAFMNNPDGHNFVRVRDGDTWHIKKDELERPLCNGHNVVVAEKRWFISGFDGRHRVCQCCRSRAKEKVFPPLHGSQFPLMDVDRMSKLGRAVHYLSLELPKGTHDELLAYADKFRNPDEGSDLVNIVKAYISLCEALDLDTDEWHRNDDDNGCEGVTDGPERDVAYEAGTIMALRIIELMRSCQTDADIIQNEFIGKIGDYEREIAVREGIEIKE